MHRDSPHTTRFAPSPNGYLHLGHAYAAMVAETAVRETGGTFRLRMEDLDIGRCRPEYESAITEDLAWLGLDWTEPVHRQSDRFDLYRAALDRLAEIGALYPCFCTRREIAAEVARSAAAPHGPEGPLYPGTCRGLSAEDRRRYMADGRGYALRLDTEKAVERVGSLTWYDEIAGPQTATPLALGDVVLARKDVPASYHLAVVVDDGDEGITLVTRGRDLFAATHIHRLLQALLDLPVPLYRHHGLVLDETGARLSKRHKALTLRALRSAGKTPDQARRMALAGLEDQETSESGGSVSDSRRAP